MYDPLAEIRALLTRLSALEQLAASAPELPDHHRRMRGPSPATGSDLRLLRVAHRLSAEAIATAARVSRRRIRQIEDNEAPTGAAADMYLRAIADIQGKVG